MSPDFTDTSGNYTLLAEDSSSASLIVHNATEDQDAIATDSDPRNDHFPDLRPLKRELSWHRDTYTGALIFNFFAFLLPALYSTLSKLWVANIDSSLVVTTDSYTYIGIIVDILNEGLPRASWRLIGDKASRSPASRLKLANTLIVYQSFLGLLISIAIYSAAASFTTAFVPEAVRAASLSYVRISAWEALTSTTETAVANATRSLDRPDVPLFISSVKFSINIVLDLLLISTFHFVSFKPTIKIQALVRFVCNFISALAGLAYYIYSAFFRNSSVSHSLRETTPDWLSLRILAKPGLITFLESAIRNGLYLWLVSGIVLLGADYATAWGVFNTIRWGLVMVPVQTLEATSLTFVSHAWGEWRYHGGIGSRHPQATRRDIFRIVSPALISLCLSLCIEVPLCILLSLFDCRPYALWLSGNAAVAEITSHMWRTIDWCYIFYAMYTQLAAIPLATRPLWYLYQSLVTNVGYVLPWAFVCQMAYLDQSNAWTYYSFVFGGCLVVSFIDIMVVNCCWVWALMNHGSEDTTRILQP